MMNIFKFLQVCFNVFVAAIVFVITTVSGLVAWLLGAIVHGMLPTDAEMDKSTGREANSSPMTSSSTMRPATETVKRVRVVANR